MEEVAEVTELTDIQKAQLLLSKDKEQRTKDFQRELEALLTKHNCSLIQGQITIQAH